MNLCDYFDLASRVPVKHQLPNQTAAKFDADRTNSPSIGLMYTDMPPYHPVLLLAVGIRGVMSERGCFGG